MKRKLSDSTTFKFCLLVLLVGATVAQFGDDKLLTWAVWFDKAVYFVGIFAAKEGIRYGAAAYGVKSTVIQSDGIKRNDN